MDEKLFALDPVGKCSSCGAKPPAGELIKCSTCKHVFHALCSNSNDDNFICRKTFLNLWNGPSVRLNFQWHCDSCLTTQEEKAVSVLEDRFDKLVALVSDLSVEVKSLKVPSDLQGSSANHDSQTNGHSHNQDQQSQSAWADQNRLKHVKSSLVLRKKSGVSNEADRDSDLKKLKAVAMNNNIPVSRVGHDSSGNTYIDCPTESDRNKLQPLLAQDFTEKEVTVLKEKLPCISIVGIKEEVTKTNLTMLLSKQNPKLEALIKSGEEFSVLFVKNGQDSHTAVARVSTKIRDAIRSDRNRLFLGITSCRVFDRFYIKRCNNCQDYGHFKDSCTNPPCCGYCGEQHDSETCPHKDKDPSTHSCVNCKRDKSQNYTGHSTFSRSCPAYLAAQKRLQSTIPYYDRNNNRRLNK